MSDPAPGIAQDEALARIRLLRSPNIGPVTYAQLFRRFGDARGALAALPDLAARGKDGGGGGKAPARYSAAPEHPVSAEIAAVRSAGARYIFHDSPDYPPMLRHCDGAPPILIARGDAAVAAQSCVAVVGARNASAAAVRLARQLAGELAERGHAVVSGLARGIDTAAHAGALAAGGGTIGVIASGIDIAYPPGNAALQEEVAAKGLLLTEHPPGTEPIARLFPARNRIIAGIALGTLVVEAAPGSGSLITARLAGEYGREVMAIPGSPLDPRSRGCNALIREGAILVQGVEDVIELITSFQGVPRSALREEAGIYAPQPPEEPEDASEVVTALLSPAPVSIDELIRQTGASAGAVQMALIELELAGRLERHAGGRVSLAG